MPTLSEVLYLWIVKWLVFYNLVASHFLKEVLKDPEYHFRVFFSSLGGVACIISNWVQIQNLCRLRTRKERWLIKAISLLLHILFFLRKTELFIMDRQRILQAAMSRAAATASSTTNELSNEARGLHDAVPARSSVLPSRQDLYGMRIRRAFNRVAHRREIKAELGYVSAIGTSNVDIPIPVLSEDNVKETECLDERLSLTKRHSSSAANLLHVGAVEITLDSTVATTADISLGGVLYDAEHGDILNSLQMAFVAPLTNEPIRILVFPNRRISLFNDVPRINSTLRLALSAPNHDMEEDSILAHLHCGVVGQLNKSSCEDTHTRYLVVNSHKSRARSIRYAHQNSVVIQGNSERERVVPRVEIPLPRSFSVRQAGNTWQRVDDPRRSVVLDFRDHPAVLLGQEDINSLDLNHEAQTDNFKSVYDMKVPLLPNASIATALATFRFDIPLNVVSGTVLIQQTLSAIVNGGKTFNKIIKAIPKLPGSLKVRATCSVPFLSGISMVLAVVEAGMLPSAKTANTRKLLTCGGKLWVPNTGQDILEENFQVLSCGNYWNANLSSGLDTEIILAVSKAWINPPKTPVSGTITVYLDPSFVIPPMIYDIGNFSVPYWREALGDLTFKQGKTEEAYRWPLKPGWPTVMANSYCYALSQACLSYFMYCHMGIEVVITRLSSLAVSGTLAIAVLPYDLAYEVDLDYIESIPHVLVQLNSEDREVIVKIPKELFPLGLSSERSRLQANDPGNPVLAVWAYDSVNSTQDGDLAINVVVQSSGNIDVSGQNSGFMLDAMRAQNFPHDWNDVASVIVKDKTEYTFGLNFQSSGNFTLRHSPIVNIMRNCVWFKGRLEWKIVWHADRKQAWSENKGHIDIEAHRGNPKSALAFARHCGVFPNGQFEFTHVMCGNMEGFQRFNGLFDQRGEDTLIIKISEPAEIHQISILCRVVDLKVCGSKYSENLTCEKMKSPWIKS